MDITNIVRLVIIIAVLLVISLVIVKLNHKNFNLEVNKLVGFLGGKDNILDTEVNMSRFKVTLKDVTKVDKEGIQKLGAKGIVEIDNQLKIIFGPDARALKKYISQLKQRIKSSFFILPEYKLTIYFSHLHQNDQKNQ